MSYDPSCFGRLQAGAGGGVPEPRAELQERLQRSQDTTTLLPHHNKPIDRTLVKHIVFGGEGPRCSDAIVLVRLP